MDKHLSTLMCKVYSLPESGSRLALLGEGPLQEQWASTLGRVFPEIEENAEHQKLADSLDTPALSNISALFWQTETPPPELARKLAKLPETTPLLLRCSGLANPEIEPKLNRILRRRRKTVCLCRPLRFWPPLCRLREISNSGVIGRLQEIEITACLESTPQFPDQRTEIFSKEDLLDCACRLFNDMPREETGKVFSQNRKECRIDFSEDRRCWIRQSARPQEKSPGPAGILEVRATGANGKLCLASSTEAYNDNWRLYKEFPPGIRPTRPSPLNLPAGNPVELELRWFLRSHGLSIRPGASPSV